MGSVQQQRVWLYLCFRQLRSLRNTSLLFQLRARETSCIHVVSVFEALRSEADPTPCSPRILFPRIHKLESIFQFLAQVRVLAKEYEIVVLQLLAIPYYRFAFLKGDLLGRYSFSGLFLQFGIFSLEDVIGKFRTLVFVPFLFKSGFQQIVIPFQLGFLTFKLSLLLNDTTPDDIGLK